MIALVLAAGPLRATSRLRAAAAEAELVVAADGGLRHARTLGVTPDLLVGDLDSVREADLTAWPDLPRERHPEDKDALDLELAVDAARSRGAREVRVVGAFGGRMDQTIAAAHVAARYAREGLAIALLDGLHDARPLTAGRRHDAELPEGTPFSLLALDGPVRLDVVGAAYELADAVLPPGTGLGLSNRAAAGGPAITVRDGLALLMVEWDEPAPEPTSPAACATRDEPAAHPKDLLWGEDAPRIEASLREADPDLADLVVDVAYGRVFARPGLSHRTRELLAIAHLTALSHEDEVRTHIRALLRQGGTLGEAKEAIVHAAMFVGFPRALAAMRALARERARHVGDRGPANGAAVSGPTGDEPEREESDGAGEESGDD